MDPFDAYTRLVAIQLHFKSDKYDIVERKGRVKSSKEAFLRRNDRYTIAALARQYTSQEITEFFVANIVSGDTTAGIHGQNSRQKYLSWKGTQQSLIRLLEQDLNVINERATLKNVTNIFESKGDLPFIIKLYCHQLISLETVVIINKILPFINNYIDLEEDDLLWPEIKKLILKYSPFVRIAHDRDRIASIIYEGLRDRAPSYASK